MKQFNADSFFMVIEPMTEAGTRTLNGCYTYYAVNRNGYNKESGGYGTMKLVVAFSTPSTLYSIAGHQTFDNALDMKAFVKRNLSRFYSLAIAEYFKRKRESVAGAHHA